MVCARCLGLYPVLFGSILAQVALRPQVSGWRDALIAFALPVPALIDWGRGRLAPLSGSNLSRIVTGALLGLSLGRTLFLHLARPFNGLTLGQLVGLAAVATAVEVVARLWRARHPTDPNPASTVQQVDRDARATGGRISS